MRIISLLLSLLLLTAAAAPQNKVPPSPAAGPDAGPSLEVTMKFIQDKVNAQDQLGYLSKQSDAAGLTSRSIYNISDVVADPATCTLHFVETEAIVHDYDSIREDGTRDHAKLSFRRTVTGTISFNHVEAVTVESVQDGLNHRNAAAGRADSVVTVVPPVFRLVLAGSKKDDFTLHIDEWEGAQTAKKTNQDYSAKEFGLIFRDEETANRLAKAMVHAVDLCGGKNKKNEPF